MARRSFTYEEVFLKEGWHSSQPDPIYEDLPRFLEEIVGARANIWDGSDHWGDFYEQVRTVQGPKGGRAHAIIYFKGIPFSVHRRQIKTVHCSERARWEVKITVRPCLPTPKEGKRVIFLPLKQAPIGELWRSSIAQVFAEAQP